MTGNAAMATDLLTDDSAEQRLDSDCRALQGHTSNCAQAKTVATTRGVKSDSSSSKFKGGPLHKRRTVAGKNACDRSGCVVPARRPQHSICPSGT
eukprot:6205763-Pleurochrysis_carterae.AAC.1